MFDVAAGATRAFPQSARSRTESPRVRFECEVMRSCAWQLRTQHLTTSSGAHGVAVDALLGDDAGHRLVAGRAVGGERRVRRRELPTGEQLRAAAPEIERQPGDEREHQTEAEPQDTSASVQRYVALRHR